MELWLVQSALESSIHDRLQVAQVADLRALDAADGKVLWESPRLNDIPNAFPITYMVDGKQYIAMPVGNTGLQGNNALGTAPELGAVRGAPSSILWVWQLP